MLGIYGNLESIQALLSKGVGISGKGMMVQKNHGLLQGKCRAGAGMRLF